MERIKLKIFVIFEKMSIILISFNLITLLISKDTNWLTNLILINEG